MEPLEHNYSFDPFVGIIFMLSLFAIGTVIFTVYFMRDKNANEIKLDNFIFNLILSVISPIYLYIIFYYIGNTLGTGWWFGEIFFIPFNLLILLGLISFVELKLFSLRKKSFNFSKTIFKVLFYLSLLATIIATIWYFHLWEIQLYNHIARSTKDGFMLVSFFGLYSVPVILWLVYYIVLKNYDSIKIFLKKIKDQKNTKTKALKRNQAIKELKEAKELLDLGVITKDEYNGLSKKLKPMILNKKS